MGKLEVHSARQTSHAGMAGQGTMTIPPLEAVLFDAVGTLFHSRNSVGETYHQIALQHGMNVDARTLHSAFLRESAVHGMPVFKDDWKTFVGAVFREHGPFPGFDAFFEDVYSFFQSGTVWRCYPEVVSVLGVLETSGFSLGVVSNFDRRLANVLEDLKIERYFSAVVTPDSARQAKPDPRIFLDATAQLDVSPGAALFVGDDPYLDIEGAKRAGLQALLVDRTRAVSDDDAIASLSALPEYLGSGS